MTGNSKFTSSFVGSGLTSIISSSLVLFLLGALIAMSLITRELSSYVKENIGFSIMMDDHASRNDLKEIEQQLNASRYVKTIEVFTKERALKELADELGENPKNFVGSVPLMASIDVKVKSAYANNDSIQAIEKELKAYKSVREIVYRKDLIQMVNENMNKIGLFLFVVAVLFMLISFVVLNNTIRLHIYSKRFILQTMKLVGATHGFIRKPFIISHIYNGAIASVLAISLLSAVFYYLSGAIVGLADLLSTEVILITFGSTFLLGILLPVLFTYFSLNRFLKMRREKLFAV